MKPHALAPAAAATDTVLSGAPFLATDIGGTHARLALVRRGADGAVELLDQHKYACADYPGLAAIVADFLSAPGRGPVRDAAIGCAGLRRGDLVVSLNLPWPVQLPELRALGIERVAAVNDFVAVAHAVQCMNTRESVLLNDCDAAAAPGPTLVVGPGTGLGAAIRVPAGARTLVVPCEAGQMAFAPGNAREIAVLERLLRGMPHVSNERFVSGPGLLRLYATLCAIDAAPARHEAPAAVVEAARLGDDAHAVEAVRMFCDAFGSLLGDLVMACGATSVYVAGGIVPKLRDLLAASCFRDRFANKGAMRPILQRVPVWLIDNPHKGVIGAAAWYLEQQSGG